MKGNVKPQQLARATQVYAYSLTDQTNKEIRHIFKNNHENYVQYIKSKVTLQSTKLISIIVNNFVSTPQKHTLDHHCKGQCLFRERVYSGKPYKSHKHILKPKLQLS
jgi:hypothetical protein